MSQLCPSRLADRSTTDAARVLEALHGQFFCTVSFCQSGKPMAIPTGFCIVDDRLVIHGSVKSHFLNALREVEEVCITSFDFQGLVLAASAFHHSVNYRSVVVFAKPEPATDIETKSKVLETFTEKYIPGRWPHLRPMTPGELEATQAVAFSLNRASLKERTGPPSFEQADSDWGVWTGILPVSLQWGTPIPDPKMKPGISIPEHLEHLLP